MNPTAVDVALARLAARRHGVFTRREATALGVTARALRSRLAAGVLVEAAPGVLMHTARAPSWHQVVAVATLGGGGAVASHRTAARLHRLDGSWSDLVEVSVPADRRGAPGLGVVHRIISLPARDLVVVDGLMATGLARTLVDLGSVAPSDVVLAALDSARRAGTSTAWLAETARRLARPGQRGPHLLLELLGETGAVPESWLERLVERLMATPGAAPCRAPAQRAGGTGPLRRPGRPGDAVDPSWPSRPTAVAFHFGDGAGRRDEDRDLRLSAAGWATLYLGYQHTRRPAEAAPARARRRGREEVELVSARTGFHR